MRDFYKIREIVPKPGVVEIFPDFKIGPSRDLMIRGGKFYAVWDEESGMWSQDEYRIQTMVDTDLYNYVQKRGDIPGVNVKVKYMADDSSGTWKKYRKYVNDLPDHYLQLDERIIFSNTEIEKNSTKSTILF